MASGDIVFEQTNLSVSGQAFGSKDANNNMGGGTSELLANSARVTVQPYSTLGTVFDRTKTYDVTIKEH